MSGHVQIALDKSAQFNPKQDQTLLNRGFLHPFPMRNASVPLQPHCSSVWSGIPNPVMHLLGASL